MDPAVAKEVAEYPFWYHDIALGDGVTTGGMWDLNRIVDRLPWPDVAGKRCLDVATFDGFYAFELERRGAAEVVAVDIPSFDEADLSWDMRDKKPWLDRFEGTAWRHGGGFALAKRALGSRAEWKPVSIYDLSPETVGTFDVVTCGSLMLHLRDPIRALEAVRTVCDGVFMSAETIEPWLTVFHPRSPVAKFRGQGPASQWWNVNAAGHVKWLESAGFEILEISKPFVVPRAHSHEPLKGAKAMARAQLIRALSRMPDRGPLHRAVIARPRSR